MTSYQNVQWFPGHMTKAKRQMEENLKKVDFIMELRDARMPDSSRNPMLDTLIRQKPRLIILTKKDKADPELVASWIDALEKQGNKVLALDLVHDSFINKIVSVSQELCRPLIEKQKRRGIRPRALRAMVCGIPNVGKSTLINRLAKKKSAQTGDRPGVTRSLQWIKLTKDLELLDTPGILWPKFEDPKTGLILALLGSVRDEVVQTQDLAMYACSWLLETKPGCIADAYDVKEEADPWQTLLNIGKKRGYLVKGEIDTDRLVRTFVRDIRDDKLGRITWEKPYDRPAA